MSLGRKKHVSLLLALCMLLNVTAVPAWAEQDAAALKKDNAAQTATSSNAQAQEEEKGDEKAELEKNAKEDEKEKDEEAVQTIEGEEIIISTEDIFADLPDNDELFAGYVERLFYGDNGIELYGNLGEDRLEGVDKSYYNVLKKVVAEIASGNRNNTQIEITLADLGITQSTWTFSELGVTSKDDAVKEVSKKIRPNLKPILDYLLVDCPYELYWFDKTANTGIDGEGMSFQISSNTITFPGKIVFNMPVAADYRGSGLYRTNSTKIQSAQKAATRAQEIVNIYKNEDDYDKLHSYFEEIKKLASYNYSAAGGGASFGDPWQVIYVFDGDEETKVVCEGYAKAFQYLCDLSTFKDENITCYIVTGDMREVGSKDAGPHMWNIVTLEEKNYLVDVTNCDQGTVGYPDRLFLAGTNDGDASSGYTFQVAKKMLYTYDNNMQEMYGDVLTLASSNYRPKENPILDTLPTPSAVYGQKLSEVKLENPVGNTAGTWEWQNPNTEVGDAGSRTFKADFTPEKAEIYKTVKGRDITVTVSQKKVNQPVIELEKDSYDYTGQSITPKVTVKDGNMIIPNTEYTVSYENNLNIGKATAVVSNKAGGNYLLPERSTKDFTIEKANLSNAELKLSIPEGGYVYDKTEKKPSVAVVFNGVTVDSSWYEVSYAQNILAGDHAQVLITAANDEFCTGSASATFAIARKPVVLTATAEDKTYDGKPDAAVTVETEGAPFIEGDEVSLGEISGAFTDYTPGEDKEVRITAVLVGNDAANYEIKSTTAKATIHPYDPKEVSAAIQKAEEAKKDIQGIDREASSVTEGTRFVSTEEMKTFDTAIEKAKTAIAGPVTAEEAKVLADELTKATETFTQAIKTGTYRRSSGGSSGGGGGGGGGGSRGTSSSRTSGGNSSSGPGSSQGTVSSDSRKGQVNSVTGIVTGTTNGAAGDGYSHWQQGNPLDNSTWKLQYADGSYAAGAILTDAAGNPYEQVAWEMIGGVWYAFGADANAKVSWVLDAGAGRWYYVDINSGMKTGWIALNGLWYYLNTDTTGALQKPFGAMFQNEMTPDGYFVNADGSWNGMPKQ